LQAAQFTVMKRRALNFLIALDQFLFCLVCLGGSNPDETASSAAYRLEKAGRWQGKVFRPVLDRLFWFDPMHCMGAYVSEVARAKSFR
jgi:hypothetical protein